ncbi:hypothetical protein EDB19DRAFT_1825132 [Suillus lakei]|nr:hypothetical protein EDB19DRAFT_1825132 [Suillus lakei]
MAPHIRAGSELDGAGALPSGLNIPQLAMPINGGTTNLAPPTYHIPYGYYPTPTSSAVSITACCLSKTDLDKIKLLDRVKNNWTSWSELMLEIFHMNLLKGYTTGMVICPDATRKPVVARNWDLRITGQPLGKTLASSHGFRIFHQRPHVLYRFSLLDNPLDRGPRTAFGPFLDRSLEFEGFCHPILRDNFSGSFWLFLALSYVEFQGISSSWNLLVLLHSPSAIFVWNFGTPPPLLPLLSGHNLLHVRLSETSEILMLGNLNHGPIPMQRFPGLPHNVVEHHETQSPPFGHIPAPAPAALQIQNEYKRRMANVAAATMNNLEARHAARRRHNNPQPPPPPPPPTPTPAPAPAPPAPPAPPIWSSQLG